MSRRMLFIILREGLFASFTGGFFYDRKQSRFVNVLHIFTWILFFVSPLITLLTPISFISCIVYTILICLYISLVKIIMILIYRKFENAPTVLSISPEGEQLSNENLKEPKDPGSADDLYAEIDSLLVDRCTDDNFDEQCRTLGKAYLALADISESPKWSDLNGPFSDQTKTPILKTTTSISEDNVGSDKFAKGRSDKSSLTLLHQKPTFKGTDYSITGVSRETIHTDHLYADVLDSKHCCSSQDRKCSSFPRSSISCQSLKLRSRVNSCIIIDAGTDGHKSDLPASLGQDEADSKEQFDYQQSSPGHNHDRKLTNSSQIEDDSPEIMRLPPPPPDESQIGSERFNPESRLLPESPPKPESPLPTNYQASTSHAPPPPLRPNRVRECQHPTQSGTDGLCQPTANSSSSLDAFIAREAQLAEFLDINSYLESGQRVPEHALSQALIDAIPPPSTSLHQQPPKNDADPYNEYETVYTEVELNQSKAASESGQNKEPDNDDDVIQKSAALQQARSRHSAPSVENDGEAGQKLLPTPSSPRRTSCPFLRPRPEDNANDSMTALPADSLLDDQLMFGTRLPAYLNSSSSGDSSGSPSIIEQRSMKFDFTFPTCSGGSRQVVFYLDRLQVETMFDRNLSLVECLACIAAAVGVCVSTHLLHLTGKFVGFDLALLCFVVAGCHYSLVKSVQPDPASPHHGFNRLILYSPAVLFSIISLLFWTIDTQFAPSSLPTTTSASTQMLLLLTACQQPPSSSSQQLLSASVPCSSDLDSLSYFDQGHLVQPLTDFDDPRVGPWQSWALAMPLSSAILSILACIIRVFPILRLAGLLPQLNTIGLHFAEQIDIHVFGGSGSPDLFSSLFSIIRALVVNSISFLILLFMLDRETVKHTPDPSNWHAILLFWPLQLTGCFLLSRLPNNLLIYRLLVPTRRDIVNWWRQSLVFATSCCRKLRRCCSSSARKMACCCKSPPKPAKASPTSSTNKASPKSLSRPPSSDQSGEPARGGDFWRSWLSLVSTSFLPNSSKDTIATATNQVQPKSESIDSRGTEMLPINKAHKASASVAVVHFKDTTTPIESDAEFGVTSFIGPEPITTIETDRTRDCSQLPVTNASTHSLITISRQDDDDLDTEQPIKVSQSMPHLALVNPLPVADSSSSSNSSTLSSSSSEAPSSILPMEEDNVHYSSLKPRKQAGRPPAYDKDPLLDRVLNQCSQRLQNDVLVCLVVAAYAYACSRLLLEIADDDAVMSLVAQIFAWIAIGWGFCLHYAWPQLIKRYPWLCFSRALFRPGIDGGVVKNEKAYYWLSFIERNLLLPFTFACLTVPSLPRLFQLLDFRLACAILCCTSMKLIRNGFSTTRHVYLNLFLATFAFAFDFQLTDFNNFPINYFIVSIFSVKVMELYRKLHFIYIYIIPFRMTWGSLMHAVLQIAFIPHAVFLLANCIFSTILSSPLEPFMASAMLIASYPRPIKFWEVGHKSERMETTNMCLASQMQGVTASQVDTNMNAIFYEHLTRSLQRSLAGDLQLGRLGGLAIGHGDFLIFGSDDLNFIIHIIEVGNGFVTFQLRGLEFIGTFCQAQETEALRNLYNADTVERRQSPSTSSCCFCCLCCCPNACRCCIDRQPCCPRARSLLSRLTSGVLQCSLCFRLRFTVWQFVYNSVYSIDGYNMTSHSVLTTVQLTDLRKILVNRFVLCILYYVTTLPNLPNRLASLEPILERAGLTSASHFDLDPAFSATIDGDFDSSVNGLTRGGFADFYLDWISYCLERRDQKRRRVDQEGDGQHQEVSASISCQRDSVIVSLAYALSLLGRRCLSNVITMFPEPSNLRGLYELFKGDVSILSKDEWIFSDIDLLQSVITPAMRIAVKLYQDYFVSTGALSHAKLYRTIRKTKRDFVICHETDPRWRLAVLNDAPSLLSIRWSKHETTRSQYRFIQMNKSSLHFSAVKINSECVRGFWAGQQREQIFIRSHNPERGSIQSAPHVFRNLVNSCCDPPIGYPIYVSPLVTSFANSNQQYVETAGSELTLLGLISAVKRWISLLLACAVLPFCRRRRSSPPSQNASSIKQSVVTTNAGDHNSSKGRHNRHRGRSRASGGRREILSGPQPPQPPPGPFSIMPRFRVIQQSPREDAEGSDDESPAFRDPPLPTPSNSPSINISDEDDYGSQSKLATNFAGSVNSESMKELKLRRQPDRPVEGSSQGEGGTSTGDRFKVVSDPELVPPGLVVGSAVEATGSLIDTNRSISPSMKATQVELQAFAPLSLLSNCPSSHPSDVDSIDKPSSASKNSPTTSSSTSLGPPPSLGLLRSSSGLHWRHRRPEFQAILRWRARLKEIIRQIFASKGYLEVDTPVLTSNCCEGVSHSFQVTNPNSSPSSSSDPVYLSSSAQLHLEALALGLSKVYTISPAFRAESSHTRHHLSEFYMIEAESIHLDSCERLCDEIESLTCHIIRQFADLVFTRPANKSHPADLCAQTDLAIIMAHLGADSSPSPSQSTTNSQSVNDSLAAIENRLDSYLAKPFTRMSYCEALNHLGHHQLSPVNDYDLTKADEVRLVEWVNGPVFITHFPTSIKPFYCQANADNPELVDAVDLLFPGCGGELVGGSVRESQNRNRLAQRMTVDDQSMDWYLQLCSGPGSAPRGGFGLGYDRLLQALLGVANIRDVVAFPRTHDKVVM